MMAKDRNVTTPTTTMDSTRRGHQIKILEALLIGIYEGRAAQDCPHHLCCSGLQAQRDERSCRKGMIIIVLSLTTNFPRGSRQK